VPNPPRTLSLWSDALSVSRLRSVDGKWNDNTGKSKYLKKKPAYATTPIFTILIRLPDKDSVRTSLSPAMHATCLAILILNSLIRWTISPLSYFLSKYTLQSSEPEYFPKGKNQQHRIIYSNRIYVHIICIHLLLHQDTRYATYFISWRQNSRDTLNPQLNAC